MMDTFPALPNELWTQALGYLSNADLKSARLSGNHRLESLASPLLFTVAYVAARRGVLHAFTGLTTHSVFRDYVKEVVYDSSWIDLENFYKYEDDTSLATMFHQQETIQVHEMQPRLDEAFKNLSALRKITYADMSKISYLPGDRDDPLCKGDYHDGPLIRRIESDDLNRAVAVYGCQQCLDEPEHDCGRPLYCGINAGVRAVFRRKQGGLRMLMQALSRNPAARLVHLMIGHSLHACGIGGVTPGDFYSNEPGNTRDLFPPVFRSLRTLNLTIAFIQQDPPDFDFAGLLKSAEHLEELTIITRGNFKAPASIRNMLADHTWRKLALLSLNGCTASQKELENFLARHKSSLRYVTLDRFILSQGRWAEVGKNVPRIAPEVQLILGEVAIGTKWITVAKCLPLDNLGVSGPLITNQPVIQEEADAGDDDQKHKEDEDDTDEEDESSEDELEYSSDDSSSETDEPRRKPDADLLITMDPDTRSKVEYLRTELPGCPVQECLGALERFAVPREAKEWLKKRFGYTDLEAMSLEKRALVERFLKELPFDCEVCEIEEALDANDNDYIEAWDWLQTQYGDRQTVWMG